MTINEAIDEALNWNFATVEEIKQAFQETPDEDADTRDKDICHK